MSITNFKKIIKYRVIHFKTIVWFTKGLIVKICKSDEHQNFKILAIKKPEYAFLASICCKSLLAVHPNSSIEVVCDQFTKKSFLINTKLIRKIFDLKIMTIESEKSWQEQKFELILSMNGSSDIFLDADLIINKKITKMANPTLFVKEFTFNEYTRYRFLKNLDRGIYNNYSMKNSSFVTFNKNSINYEEIEKIELLTEFISGVILRQLNKVLKQGLDMDDKASFDVLLLYQLEKMEQIDLFSQSLSELKTSIE